MLFRFDEIPVLSNGLSDYDNKKYLGSIEHDDYSKYIKFLYWAKENNISIHLVKEIPLADGESKMELDDDEYKIIDIIIRVSLDNNANTELVRVFVESYDY
jgi:hypothetical protein